MKFFTTITIFFTSVVAFGQDEGSTPDQIAFDEALGIYYDEEYDSALILFEHFLSNHPSSNLIPRAKYNIGYVLKEIGRSEESIPIFKELLESGYNDKERFGGLMEQYALYKHRSASHLADIYLELENYEMAKKYIRLFDKKYKYQHFCGNELAANDIYTAKQYARLYYGEGKIDKAIKELVPFIFDNGLTSNQSLLDFLTELLEKRYSEQQLKVLVDQARSSLEIRKNDEAKIEFLGTRVAVYDYALYDFGNIEFQKNLELTGREKWEKVFNTNGLFAKYVD